MACGTRLTQCFHSGSPSILMTLPMLWSGNYKVASSRLVDSAADTRALPMPAAPSFSLEPGQPGNLTGAYTDRNAWIGSAEAARVAGIADASNATSIIIRMH